VAGRAVVHYGPAPGTPGGMAAVLEALAALPVDGFPARVVTTWHPDARFWSLGAVTRSLLGLRARDRRRAISHVHLSERGSFVREGAVVVAASLAGSDVVVSLHGADFEEFLDGHRRLVRFVLGRAAVVCALGPRTAEVVGPLVPRGRVVVVPNPAALPSATTSAGEQDERVLFAGEVGTRKGVDVLLDAWPDVIASRPSARLLIAGPPGDVAEREVPGVEWLGVLGRNDVGRLLDEVRVAVLPSRAEVLPMFVLEAMARGRPVVASDVAEIAWLVGDGGTTVPPQDRDALARALVELLGSPSAAEAAGRAGRARAEAEFAGPAIADVLRGVYSSL
jgi:glycosyltransferase involved in cell wall biosynthesis